MNKCGMIFNGVQNMKKKEQRQTNIGQTHTSHTSSKLDWPTPAEGPVTPPPKLPAPDKEDAVYEGGPSVFHVFAGVGVFHPDPPDLPVDILEGVPPDEPAPLLDIEE